MSPKGALLLSSLLPSKGYVSSSRIKTATMSMTDSLVFQARSCTWEDRTFQCLIVGSKSPQWSGPGNGSQWYRSSRCHGGICNIYGCLLQLQTNKQCKRTALKGWHCCLACLWVLKRLGDWIDHNVNNIHVMKENNNNNNNKSWSWVMTLIKTSVGHI